MQGITSMTFDANMGLVMRRGSPSLLCVVLVASLASCSAYVPAPRPGDVGAFGLSRGDRIRIHTDSGQVLEDTFVGVTGTKLSGRSHTLELASISSVEKRSFSVVRTLALLGGLGLGVLLLMGASYGSGAG